MLERSVDLLEPFVRDWLSIMLRLFLYAALVIFLFHALIVVLFPYSLDYGEAPLVDQALRLAGGKNIYRADISSPPFTISNYPPLYVLSVTPFIKLFGPTFLVGRMISTLSALVSATFLALIIYAYSQERVAAVVTGLSFLAIPFVVSWSPLARVDMLAMAFSSAGLYVVSRWPMARRGNVIGAILLVAAIYTRQSYALAAPLAAFVWLWTHERRRAIEFALLVAALVLVLFIVLNVLTGGGFLYNTVTANVNEFGIERLVDWLEELADKVPILLILGAIFVFVAPLKRMKMWSLVVPYLVGAFLSALTIGKIGSNANYLLELSAALSLVAGALVFWSRPHRWRHVVLLLLLTLQTGLLMSNTLDGPVTRLRFRIKAPHTLELLQEMVAETDGPVLADEQMGMLTLQERPLFMQPFEVTQLALAGKWDQSVVLRGIQNQEYPLILVYQFPFTSIEEVQRWTPEMLAAIEANYTSTKNMDGNVVYRPKGWQETAEAPPPAQRPGFRPTDVQVGPVQQLGQQPYVYDPHVTVNPQHDDHLAATVVQAADLNCDVSDCEIKLLLYTSTDDGENWTEQVPLDQYGRAFTEGMVSFGADGTLYTLGLHSRLNVNRSTVDSGAMPYQVVPTQTVAIPSSQVFLQPWLQVDPRDGELFVAYSGRTRENLGINLKRSQTGGDEWTYAITVEDGVPLAEFQSGQATPPLGPQLLLGEGERLAVVWAWAPGFWQWPTGVWIATSDDAGQAFSSPRRIAETWGFVSAAAHNNTLYVFYRWGTEQAQELAAAVSRDGGASWDAVSVSGDLPLHYDPTKAPGVGVAPNGRVDVVFYANSQDAPACDFEMENWRRVFFGETWIDSCDYDAYYAFSEDGGQTFSVPLRLNEAPIHGERFVRADGMSLAGFRLGMASADAFAYPIWIETQGDQGTQVVTVRIER